MKTLPVDYATAYFDYPVLDKIQGEPASGALRYPNKQLKFIAPNMIFNLVGGQHGHLDLVLYPIEYALLLPHCI